MLGIRNNDDIKKAVARHAELTEELLEASFSKLVSECSHKFGTTREDTKLIIRGELEKERHRQLSSHLHATFFQMHPHELAHLHEQITNSINKDYKDKAREGIGVVNATHQSHSPNPLPDGVGELGPEPAKPVAKKKARRKQKTKN